MEWGGELVIMYKGDENIRPAFGGGRRRVWPNTAKWRVATEDRDGISQITLGLHMDYLMILHAGLD
jgi:hypothetical protein